MNKNSLPLTKMLEFFLESTSDIIIVTNDIDIIELHNEQLIKKLQLSNSNIVGTSINDILPKLNTNEGDTIYMCDLLMYKFKVKIRSYQCENGFKRKYFLLTEIPSHNNDLTDYKNDILLNEACKKTLNNIDEGVILVDNQCRIIFYNKVQSDFDHLKLEHVYGKATYDLQKVPPELSVLYNVIKSQKPQLNYVQHYCVNNNYLKLEGNAFPVKLNNTVIGAVAIYKNLAKSEETVQNIITYHSKFLQNNKQHSIKPTRNKSYYQFKDIIGNNKHLLKNIDFARRAAQTFSSVFLYGETGTGKELFAQSIHSASNRATKPFLAINCAAIPETLLEGILFGTSKGVFTGAISRQGLLESANGGTLFLDEINSMPLTLQAKLLRVLEERKIMRLGEKHEVPLDIRIISSSNIDPKTAIIKKQLRSDIFYRLAVVTVNIPTLNQRIDDIPLLVSYFIDYYNKLLNKHIKTIKPQDLEKLKEYTWPGNVRQLKHYIECIMNVMDHDENTLTLKHYPYYFHTICSNHANELSKETSQQRNIFDEIFAEERISIIDALKRNRGNISKAAQDLGLSSRSSLYHRIKKHNLK